MNTPQAKRFVDGFATSHDWQRHVGGVAILPIGSFEQHGGHLPVATDDILVDCFSRWLAREIGAALLPVVPIFQAYEHAGFRGSFSLRPETAMAVVRDLVDACAAQNFTRLIILNGHGGNFALPTVVRDINRHDGPVKVMLVNYAELCDADLQNFADDMHSGAWETSLLAAATEFFDTGCWGSGALNTPRDASLSPLVGDLEATGEPVVPIPAALRSDLNHFGLGTLRPRGPWGDQRQTDIAQGRRILASLQRNLLDHVRTRLAWFDEHPAYGGPGTVLLREMLGDDIPGVMALIRAAGWNQTPEDLQAFLDLAPEGCFVAVRNGRIVATTTAVNYGDEVGWIGMVLVDPAVRRRGIATMMMRYAIELLDDCKAIKLDATQAGREVYGRLGFVDACRLRRLVCEAVGPVEPQDAPGLRAMTEADLPAVVALDARVFGTPREGLIRRLFKREARRCFVIEDGEGFRGMAMARSGASRLYFGPAAAADEATARALIARIAADCRGRAACIDVHDSAGEGFVRWLEGLGFVFQRPFIRMVRGEDARPGRPAEQIAIAGPAWG